jgi:hypothetical protein
METKFKIIHTEDYVLAVSGNPDVTDIFSSEI